MDNLSKYFIKIQNDSSFDDSDSFDIFEKDEISKINNYLGLKFSNRYYLSVPGKACVISFSISDDCYSTSIFKLRDEWYYITHYCKDETKHTYKCDQMEGLIKCMDSIL